MKSFSSYLVVMFMLLFWIFQVVGAVCETLGLGEMIPVINMTYQIPVIFASFVCILLVVKRNVIGAIAYLILHGWYYGMDLYQSIMNLSNGSMGMSDYTSIMISFIGVVLAIVVLMELVWDKNHQKHGGDKKTDWYYGTDEYTREKDEREDNNNYRTM